MESDDEVVAEIPVYYRTCDPHQIALISYPLRPRDRPYDGPDLGALHRVQIKPEHGSLQFQYRSERRRDEDGDEAQARVFTLMANRLQPQATYAIGQVRRGQLHLTPIEHVYAMLPDFAAVDAAAAAAKASMRVAGDTDDAPEVKAAPKEVLLRAAQMKSASSEPSEARKSYPMLRQEWDAEKWVTLQVEAEESGGSVALRETLAHVGMDECDRIPMDIPLGDYLSTLCCGATSPAAESSSSLQARCVRLLKNAGVMQFGELCDVLGVADDARDDLVKVLTARAVLVQNCWVPKSSLLVSGRASTARDFLLQLFNTTRDLSLSEWTDVAQLDLETSLQIMRSLATLDQQTKRWVFKCEFDYNFGASYDDVVAEQNRALRQLPALAQLTGRGAARSPPATMAAAEVVAHADQRPVAAVNIDLDVDVAQRAAAPSELRSTVVKAEPDSKMATPAPAGSEPDPDVRYFVSEQLEKFGVVTVGALLTAYRATGRTVTEAAMVGAVHAIARPFVGSGFCRKTIDANDEEFEAFRNAFIDLFRSAPSRAMRKSDIKAEILQRTNVELPEKAYGKLTKELARLIKGSWIAKTAE